MPDVTGSSLRTDFAQILAYGELCRFRYFSVSGANAGYDDNVTLTISGTDQWVSGLVQPFRQSSNDPLVLAQGKDRQADIHLFVDGGVQTSGTFRVGIGSANPPSSEYSLVPAGVQAWTLNGSVVYKKLDLRRLTTGSLQGE